MKQKILTYFAATVTAILTAFITIAGMWAWTQKDLLEIIIVAYFAAIFTFAGVLAVFADEKEYSHR